ETAQDAVGAPVLGEFHRRAQQVPLVFLQLRLEALEQRERIGGTAGEPGKDAVLVEAAHLARGRLQHDVAEADLAVAAERDAVAAPHRQDGCTVEGIVHGGLNGTAQRQAGNPTETKTQCSSTLSSRSSVATSRLGRMTRTVLPRSAKARTVLPKFAAHTKSMRASFDMLMLTYWR